MKLHPYINKIRHLRGHGLHSPFIYGVYRNVFMGDKPATNQPLYRMLIQAGLRNRAAREIVKLHSYCIGGITGGDSGMEYLPVKIVPAGIGHADAGHDRQMTVCIHQHPYGYERFIGSAVDAGTGICITRKRYTVHIRGREPYLHIIL